MSDEIPDHLESVLEAVEEVCAEFESEGEFRPFGAERWIRDLELTWEDVVQHVAFVLDTEAPLLSVYVVLRVPDAARHGDSLAKAVARANYGLLPGCFEIDLDTGETRYRSVLQLYSDEIATRDVAQLLAGALQTTKAYARAFQKVAQSGADPLEAVDEVESE